MRKINNVLDAGFDLFVEASWHMISGVIALLLFGALAAEYMFPASIDPAVPFWLFLILLFTSVLGVLAWRIRNPR